MYFMKPILQIGLFLYSIILNAQSFCGSSQYSDINYFNAEDITIISNIEYGRADDYLGRSVALQADVYMPTVGVDTTSHRPFVLLLHGGGFQNGGKGAFSTTAQYLAKAGYVVASINYRLGWDSGTSPCTGSLQSLQDAEYRAMQDAHAAVRYFIEYYSTYKIDTTLIFIGGSSAGSTTALQLAYYNQDEAMSLSKSLGSLYTSGNPFNHTFTVKGILNECGGVTDTAFLKADTPIPIIAFHGSHDKIVPIDTGRILNCYKPNMYHFIAGSSAIHQTIATQGICSELNIYVKGRHCPYTNDSLVAMRAACFFKSIMCNTCITKVQEGEVWPSCNTISNTSNQYNNLNFTVFPNPTADKIVIQSHQPKLKPLTFKILSISGKLITTGTITNSETEVDISDCDSGLYYLITMNAHTLEAKKIIKL